MTVKPEHLNQLLHPQFVDSRSDSYRGAVVAKGLPASPGAAVGKIAFTADEAEAMHSAGEKCILVRDDTSPEGASVKYKGVHEMIFPRAISAICFLILNLD